jgi:Zn-dependent M16 (insulinase) family peptidase
VVICCFYSASVSSVVVMNVVCLLSYVTAIAFCRMGVTSMDYKELSEQIELKTGGLDVSPHIADHHSDPKKFEQA